ncbi:MAG: hypothetical protein V3U32_03170 [Anaerolineales bacterium]
MNGRLNFRIVSITFALALVLSYLLCIAAGLLFGWSMYEAWMPLLPGFTWPLTAGGFVIGLLWLVGYSVYGAALLVVPFNYLSRRSLQDI